MNLDPVLHHQYLWGKEKTDGLVLTQMIKVDRAHFHKIITACLATLGLGKGGVLERDLSGRKSQA